MISTLVITSSTNTKIDKEPGDVRLKYNNPDLIVDLGVGLWANPIPVDWDNDGDTDLMVSCTDKPSNGLFYFENVGNNLFLPGKQVAEGKKETDSFISGWKGCCMYSRNSLL